MDGFLLLTTRRLLSSGHIVFASRTGRTRLDGLDDAVHGAVRWIFIFAGMTGLKRGGLQWAYVLDG